jgi:hypothetical protein
MDFYQQSNPFLNIQAKSRGIEPASFYGAKFAALQKDVVAHMPRDIGERDES